MIEQGFLLDESYGQRKPSKWVEGELKYWMCNPKLRGRRLLELVSDRCRQCGYLESYAPE